MSDDSLGFLLGPASEVAPRLLGCILERRTEKGTIRVKIVETEAYDQSDVASHSFKGKTLRNEIMFGPAGCLYVYFTYGMHYCCNVVVGPVGHGAAVLIRAVEPLEGMEIILQRRGKKGIEATNGPAKLCQALGIDKMLNGHNLKEGEIRLIPQPKLAEDDIIQTSRIGISRGKELPWRYYISQNIYVSTK